MELKNLQRLLEQEQKKRIDLEKRLTLLSLSPTQQLKKLHEENQLFKEENEKLVLKMRHLELLLEEEKRKNEKLGSHPTIDSNQKGNQKLNLNQIAQKVNSNQKVPAETTMDDLTKIETLMEEFQKEQTLRKSLERQIKRNTIRLDESRINPIYQTSFSIFNSGEQKAEVILNDLFRSELVQDISSLEKIIETENGLRWFIKTVQRSSKKLSSFYVHQQNFVKLTHLLEKCLSLLSKQKSVDFFSAIKILKISRVLHTREQNSTVPIYLKDQLRNSEIWQNLQIWVEYFCTEVFKKQR